MDFGQRLIVVRDGKGMEDRAIMLPEAVVVPLQEHLQRAKRLHERDLAQGRGSVYLPLALERKYPSASREWIRQYIFRTTMTYTLVLKRGRLAVRSSLDQA